MIVEEQRLCTALTLVVTGPWADGVDIAPVALDLGVDGGVSDTSDVEACRILALTRLARPKTLIEPWTFIFVVWTGSFW